MKTVITYGTFDLLHYGHIELLRRCKELADGGTLIVGLSSDEFNQTKEKKSHIPYTKRKEIVESLRYVDQVIPENSWEQKQDDIKEHSVDIFVMGDDWKSKFDDLKDICEVIYLERTPVISTSVIKNLISELKELESDLD